MKPVFTTSSCPKNIIVCSFGNFRRRMAVHVSDAIFRVPSNHLSFRKNLSSCWSSTYTLKHNSSVCVKNCFNVQRNHLTSNAARSFTCGRSLTLRCIVGSRCYRSICSSWITRYEKMKLRLSVPKQYKCNLVPFSWRQHSFAAAFFFVLFVYCSISQLGYAKAPKGFVKKDFYCDGASSDYTQRKPVLTNYSVIGIPGDGRCLFRSVAHGACIRSGKSAPSQAHQMELADDLRSKVAEEFIKRRKETEWFIEGDFDTYVSQIRKPHVWGGEPELLMASHVLEMPITVYMYDDASGGLISIAEYGQEYGKDDPIRVMFHGYGHYDAIHVAGNGATGRGRSRL